MYGNMMNTRVTPPDVPPPLQTGKINLHRLYLHLSYVLIILLSGCSKQPLPLPTAAPVTPTMVITEDDTGLWREDLQSLVKALTEQHREPFRTITEVQFMAAVDDLNEHIPDLTDEQIVFGFMQLVAMIRDGHTFITPLQEELDYHMYPLRLYWFSDGLFVIDARAPHHDTIGKRVMSIGNATVDEAYKLIEPTISADNDMSALAIAPIRMILAEELLALGITTNLNEPEFILEDESGHRSTLNLEPISISEYREWVYPTQQTGRTVSVAYDEITYFSGLPQQEAPLYLSHRSDRFFWMTYLEDSDALYIQCNSVQGASGNQSISTFSNEVADIARTRSPKRVIVDLRHNPGGEIGASLSLERVIRETPEINQPGKLFVIIGRDTFSAASWFALRLARETNAIFVGEPMGGGRVTGGGAYPTRLPNSQVQVYISTEWNIIDSDPAAPPTLEPHHTVVLSASEFFAGLDPVMDFILAYPGPQ